MKEVTAEKNILNGYILYDVGLTPNEETERWMLLVVVTQNCQGCRELIETINTSQSLKSSGIYLLYADKPTNTEFTKQLPSIHPSIYKVSVRGAIQLEKGPYTGPFDADSILKLRDISFIDKLKKIVTT